MVLVGVFRGLDERLATNQNRVRGGPIPGQGVRSRNSIAKNGGMLSSDPNPERPWNNPQQSRSHQASR